MSIFPVFHHCLISFSLHIRLRLFSPQKSFPMLTPPSPAQPNSASWPLDLSNLHPLNIPRTSFAKQHQRDKWLGPLVKYLCSNNDVSVLAGLLKKGQSWVITTAKHCVIINGLLMYVDEFIDDAHHYRIFVPSDPDLQKHFLRAYHDSPMGMHRGHDATYNCLRRDFYCVICRSMCEIGRAAARIVSDSNPFSLPIGLCRFGFISTLFTL